MATDQTINTSPMIFSYKNVIKSHFQLLDAWYKVRLFDLSGIDYTR
jgi:hypothetical protein